jgi:hypothetical protein
MKIDLSGVTAVVTGSTGGIGVAIARGGYRGTSDDKKIYRQMRVRRGKVRVRY